jgi:hypothetical protein
MNGKKASQISAKGMVRAEGLEPPQLASPEPKSGASTNSATPAADAAPTRSASCFGRALYQLDCLAPQKKA